MRCDEVREMLSARLDGALAPAEEAAVRAHLGGCPECREAGEGLESVSRLLRGIPRPAAPEGFGARVAATLPAARPARGRLLYVVPAAAAACAAVVLALVLLAPPEREPDGSGFSVSWDARPGPGALPREYDPERDDPDLVEVRSVAGSGPAAADGPLPERHPADRGAASAPGAPAAPEEAGGVAAASAGDRAPAIGYFVSGPSPDAAAGILLAELEHRRRREDGRKEAHGRIAERLVADERGEPSSLVLCLTLAETEFLVRLIRARGATVLARADPPAEPGGGAEAGESDRCRVEFRFGK